MTAAATLLSEGKRIRAVRLGLYQQQQQRRRQYQQHLVVVDVVTGVR
jgi:hypothetical protein